MDVKTLVDLNNGTYFHQYQQNIAGKMLKQLQHKGHKGYFTFDTNKSYPINTYAVMLLKKIFSA